MTLFTLETEENFTKRLGRLKKFIIKEATFFRIHLLCFIIIPLIASGVFYACNGRFRVSYVDSLFLCYSAMTVTGLSTINLSTITAWQQVILYILMAIGDITVASWVMVLIRKHYFRTECIRFEEERKQRLKKLIRRSKTAFSSLSSPIQTRFRRFNSEPVKHGILDIPAAAHPVMESPKSIGHTSLVSPVTAPEHSSLLEDETSPGLSVFRKNVSSPDVTHTGTLGLAIDATKATPRTSVEDERNERFFTDQHTMNSSPRTGIMSLHDGQSAAVSPISAGTRVTFATQEYPRRRLTTIGESVPLSRPSAILGPTRRAARPRPSPLGLHHVEKSTSQPKPHYDPKYHGLGGFPGPLTVAQNLFPNTYKKIERKLMMSVTPSLITTFGEKPVKLNEEVKIGGLEGLEMKVRRNSFFDTDNLSDDELERIGGVEYRALRFLSYLVAFYFIGTQLFSYILFAPWLSAIHQYDEVFNAQPRLVQKPWFALFQVMGSYTGGGLSLVDQGMLPFQKAYLMIFALMFVILAGNHALPIFLRLTIWIFSKLVKPGSEMDQTLTFLLHHPRRCFIYLFPSHQTWFLVVCLVLFSIVEWIAFLILNIGLEVTDSIPVGTRIVASLFQGLAARASGFSIVPVAELAPAVQFLYAVMMYIAVYPVAMTIRSTNVYEERSLGVFEDDPESDSDEPEPSELTGTRGEKIGKYLRWHVRRQMSIDLWWLVWGVFLTCIIERGNLLDPTKKWFELFRVLFELVSAFGGIGLSLGVPFDNFSFSGALKPLSKLVIIVIMVRGRHRGLPLAVDRAILLPQELALRKQQQPQTPQPPELI